MKEYKNVSEKNNNKSNITLLILIQILLLKIVLSIITTKQKFFLKWYTLNYDVLCLSCSLSGRTIYGPCKVLDVNQTQEFPTTTWIYIHNIQNFGAPKLFSVLSKDLLTNLANLPPPDRFAFAITSTWSCSLPLQLLMECAKLLARRRKWFKRTLFGKLFCSNARASKWTDPMVSQDVNLNLEQHYILSSHSMQNR